MKLQEEILTSCHDEILNSWNRRIPRVSTEIFGWADISAIAWGHGFHMEHL